FYCRSGARSAMASDAFSQAGFDAHNMTGGLLDWDAAGLPLEPEDGYVAEGTCRPALSASQVGGAPLTNPPGVARRKQVGELVFGGRLLGHGTAKHGSLHVAEDSDRGRAIRSIDELCQREREAWVRARRIVDEKRLLVYIIDLDELEAAVLAL